jgi:hypothetical protein
MKASLPWWTVCLNLGALLCLLGSAGSFADRPSSPHQWLTVLLPLGLAVTLLSVSAKRR